MSATSNTSQLFASLAANTAPTTGRNRPGSTQDGVFQASLDQQITQFRPEPAPVEAPVRAATEPVRAAAKPVERPAEKAVAPKAAQNGNQAAEGAEHVDKRAVADGDTAARPASERAGVSKESAQAGPADEEQAMATAAQATAILQLQQMLSPVVEPLADTDTPTLDAVLQGEDGDAALIARLSAELNGKDGLSRQTLPGVAAKTETSAEMSGQALLVAAKEPGVLLSGKSEPEDFSQLLEQRLSAQSSGLAAQQSGIQAIRVEPLRTQELETTRPQMSIFQPVGGEGWDKALGTRMVMMVSNQQQEVEMQLNPPHLGPMEIKLTLDKDQASVTFVALHAPVREALQASMPKLSEMLAESGIQLADAQVQSQAQRDQAGNENGPRRHGHAVVSESLDLQSVPINALRSPTSLLAPGTVSLFV